MGRPLLRDEIPVGACKVRALFSWSGESPQDLGFVEGDIIEVLNNGDGDWWTGKLKRNKQVGIFPRNFAEYVDPEQETMSAALSKSPPRKKTGLGEYQLESPPIDFSTVSLADLAISDPQNGEEPSLVLGSRKVKEQKQQQKAIQDITESFSRLDPKSPTFDSKFDTASTHALGESTSSKAHPTGYKLTSLSPNLGSSTRSTKSAQEILDEISHEMNQQFLDDINLDAHTEDLLTVESNPASKTPVPPPHRSLNSSINSAFERSGTKSTASSSSLHHHSRSQSLVPETVVTLDHKPKQRSSALTGPVPDQGNKSELGADNAIVDPGTAQPDVDNLMGKLDNPASLDFTRSPIIEGNHSPLLDQEIPFDPKAFKPERSIGDHIGSHFDTGYTAPHPSNDSPAAHTTSSAKQGPPIIVNPENNFGSPRKPVAAVGSTITKTASKAAQLQQQQQQQQKQQKSSTTQYTSTYIPPKEAKLSFFQRLLPKNSQTLRRKTSRSSQKSSRSSKLTAPIASKLRTVKSIFSFNPEFEPDDSIYPSNMETKAISAPVPPITPNPPMTSSSLHRKGGSNVASLDHRASLNGFMKSSIGASEQAGNGQALLGSSTTSSTYQSPLASLAKNGNLSSTSTNNKNSAAGTKWIESRRDLYRAQTLTERDMKKRRQELELQGVNCDNIVENLNRIASEDFHDYRLESFDDVDQAVLTMSTWPQLMTPSVFASSRIGRHFSDPVERVRAVFLLCSTRIEHVDSTPVHNNVMQNRKATSKELAQTVAAMCNALDIECEVIEGHMRHLVGANATSITSTPHWWNAVKVHDEWRLLDAVTAATPDTISLVSSARPPSELGHQQDDDFVNLFYFLTPPVQLIYSHIPENHHKQYLQPSLPTATASLLPLATPAAFAHNIDFDEYWLGMTRLADLEACELHMRVPDKNEDLVAFVNGKPALAQAFYKDNGSGGSERLFRVKGFVPPNNRQALLQIYVTPKDQASRDLASLELLWNVELRHVSGMQHNTAFEFVTRHNAPSVSHYDFYVSEPQCRGLTGGDTYTFKVENFSHCTNQSQFKHLVQPQLAIQSPSGRLTRLIPIGTDVNDTFRGNVKTMEVGTWRAVARQDDTLGWVPFAEWFCS